MIFGKYLDGSFCAYTGDEVIDPEREIICACLAHVVDLEPSIGELADLPAGWWAERATPAASWVRERIPEDEL